jgi:glyoxylase-like metal-dependent hydrolase (beta-lactamase superfamily II)/rhodanese-related sulfurtransferase
MARLRFARLLVWLVLVPASWAAASGEIDDAESGTHGFEAAQYQVVDTYDFPDFKVVQYDLAVLSHYSYMLISGGEALVVDPGRDIFTYVETAEKEGVKITGVWLSHSHADFIAGHMEFAARLNVPLHISGKAQAEYQHEPLQEGDTLETGRAVVRFIETPGHTLDSMCGVVYSARDRDKPLIVLSGDTLFIGSVGRPDLLGKNMSASTLAGMMYDTWTNKLSKLPDDVMILPAHGAGSLCGAHLSDAPVSTIGQEQLANKTLGYTSRGAFIAAVLDGLPEAPQYFAHNAAMNRKGPELAEWEFETLPLLEPGAELTDPAKYYVVDVRDAEAYASGHIPDSVNIALRGRFETWMGVMVPWEAKKVVAGDEEQIREALYRLNRIGYTAQAVLVDGWKQAGLPVTANNRIHPRELYGQMQTKDSPLVVDVRLPAEWMALRIGSVVNIPLNELGRGGSTLDPGDRVVTVCNSAYRSSMALGILERQGFTQVSSLEGGSQAWIDAGLPVLEAQARGTTDATPKRQVRLAERISAAELKRMILDLPGTFTLVDIRPPAHYDDYNLPDSVNVETADLLENPAYLTGVGPLVIVDRDGSLAMMVAGILSQKSDRPVKALYGGLAAYWDESDLGGLTATSVLPGRPAASSARTAAPIRPRGSASPMPTKPQVPAAKSKKRSAGC